MRKLALTILGWFAMPRRKPTAATAVRFHRHPAVLRDNGGWVITPAQACSVEVIAPDVAGQLAGVVRYRMVYRRDRKGWYAMLTDAAWSRYERWMAAMEN